MKLVPTRVLRPIVEEYLAETGTGQEAFSSALGLHESRLRHALYDQKSVTIGLADRIVTEIDPSLWDLDQRLARYAPTIGRKNGKEPDLPLGKKIPARKLEAISLLNSRAGMRLEDIGAATYRQLGFPSAYSCYRAISVQLRALGLPIAKGGNPRVLRLTDEQLAEAIDLYVSGKSVSAIVEAKAAEWSTGWSPHTLGNALRRAFGDRMRTRSEAGAARALGHSRIETFLPEVRALYEAGWSVDRIARERSEGWGYRSWYTCRSAILTAFRRHGDAKRGRAEVNRLAWETRRAKGDGS